MSKSSETAAGLAALEARLTAIDGRIERELATKKELESLSAKLGWGIAGGLVHGASRSSRNPAQGIVGRRAVNR